MARVSVIVMPKGEVLDPQGKAVLQALHNLGFSEVADCRIGKVISLIIDGRRGRDALEAMVEEMARALLANPVTEDFRVILEEL